MKTLRIVPLDGPTDLLGTLPSGQVLAPPPAYLIVDFHDGELLARSWADQGMPDRIHNRHALCLPIPCLTAAAANRLLEEVLPIAQRIYNGYTNDSGFGRLDEDAVAAQEELTVHLAGVRWDDSDKVQVWHASTWLCREGFDEFCARVGLTADTTDFQLAVIGDQVEREFDAFLAAENRSGSLYGLTSSLRDLRTELRRVEAEHLERLDAQITALDAERDRFFRRMAAWGWSARRISRLTSVSAPTVGSRIDRDTAAQVLARLDVDRAWFGNVAGVLVYDDNDARPLYVPAGGGEVRISGPTGPVGTGVIVRHPRLSEAEARESRPRGEARREQPAEYPMSEMR